MPAAVVRKTGAVRSLEGRASPTQRLTSEQVQDPERLTREVNELRETAAKQERRHDPRRIDFEDISVDGTGTTQFRLAHGFGGRVRWWPVDWSGSGGLGGAACERHEATDANTLVLVSYVPGTVTVRVEEAG